MSDILIDIVEGAELDNAILGSTLQRIAHITGLDVGAPIGDPSVFIRSLGEAGMPQWYDHHPTDPSFIVNRHVIKPISDSAVVITIYYYRGVVVLSTWIESESTTTINDTTTIHPNGTPLTITMNIPGVGQIGSQVGPVNKLKSYLARMSYPRTIRKITFEGSVFGLNLPGAPADVIIIPGAPGRTKPATRGTYSQAVNSVNSVPWRGYDIGYWWFNEWEIVSPDWGVTSTVRASVLSKMTEDWSEYDILKDTANGKYVFNTAAVAPLKSLPYTYGVTAGNVGGNSNQGIIKVGFYPLIDFFTLFGS